MKNRLFQNNEGISPVLGFILILAICVTLLTTVQLSFVPVWNTQEELDHIKLMQDDFKVLKSNIESGIQSGTTLSSPLIMGFKYSPKMLVYNPRDEAYASLEVTNNTWIEVRYNEVFSEGMTDETSIKNISTGMITYTLRGAQNYNSFIYENGLIRRRGSDYTASSQTVLANNTIFLPSLKALEYGTASGVEKRTVNIYPTSQQKNSVIGQNVWLILHTDPDYVDWWETNLENEGATVRKKDATNGIVIANISSVVIKMGEAYISSSQKAAPPHSPARRLVKVSSQTAVLPVEGVTNLIVEVQDEYNNPVPTVLVSFNENLTKGPSNSYLNGDLLSLSAVSGADGRASVPLKTAGAGFYYVDAVIPGYTTTFAYSASSQGYVMELDAALYSADYYNVTATLKDSLGTLISGTNVDFDTSDGSIIPGTVLTASGIANTTLNISNANVTSITNIQEKEPTTNSTNITWDTINNIIVNAKSGYVFNSKAISTTISTSGCVMFGTTPGIYSLTPKCDTNVASPHSVSLTGLTPNTAYYFIVNSSRPGKESVNSTEYMFVTEGTGDDTPPASVTNLINATYEPLYIRWTWTDPTDADFDHVDVKIDEVSAGIVLKGTQSFNATYLMPNSSHNISIRTVDTSNNVNGTWVTHNATTKSLFTYVAGYEIIDLQGAVTDFPNAQNAADGGAAALFNETQLTGTSDRNNYTYVTSNSATNGTVTNFANMQSNVSGAFANLTEGAGTGGGGGTSNATASVKGTSDTTTDVIADLQANDTIGPDPSSVVASDGWYTVDKSNIMYIDSFNTGGMVGSVSSATLWMMYSVEVGYSGTNRVRWGRQGAVLNTTGIQPLDGQKYQVQSYNLFAQGVNTLSEISTLNIEFTNNDGSGPDAVSFDYVWIQVTYSGATTYSLNITTDTSSVPDDTSHYLEINYSRDAADTYGVYVWNGTDWNNRSSLNASGTWAVRNISLNAGEYNGGNPRVRYIDENPAGTSRGNLSIDYQRIHGYTPGIPGGYHLDVRTNTSGIPDAVNQKLQLMYNATGDNFTLQLYNGSSFSWDPKETLNKSAMTLVEVPLTTDYLLSDGNFGSYTVNNLPRYYVLVRYLDNRDAAPVGKLYLDYQRVYSW